MKTKMLMVFTSLTILMVLFSGCKKDDKPNYSELILGMWVNTHVNNEAILTDASYSMEFKSDQTENYAIGFQLDENNNWIKKSDNEGRYFLYGNLFASNYSNDLISGGIGLAYECWNFNIVDNTMTWSGLRENDIIVTYEMEKVDEAPITR